MQLAPLFFDDPTIGVELLPAELGINASALVDVIADGNPAA